MLPFRATVTEEELADVQEFLLRAYQPEMFPRYAPAPPLRHPSLAAASQELAEYETLATRSPNPETRAFAQQRAEELGGIVLDYRFWESRQREKYEKWQQHRTAFLGLPARIQEAARVVQTGRGSAAYESALAFLNSLLASFAGPRALAPPPSPRRKTSRVRSAGPGPAGAAAAKMLWGAAAAAVAEVTGPAVKASRFPQEESTGLIGDVIALWYEEFGEDYTETVEGKRVFTSRLPPEDQLKAQLRNLARNAYNAWRRRKKERREVGSPEALDLGTSSPWSGSLAPETGEGISIRAALSFLESGTPAQRGRARLYLTHMGLETIPGAGRLVTVPPKYTLRSYHPTSPLREPCPVCRQIARATKQDVSTIQQLIDWTLSELVHKMEQQSAFDPDE